MAIIKQYCKNATEKEQNREKYKERNKKMKFSQFGIHIICQCAKPILWQAYIQPDVALSWNWQNIFMVLENTHTIRF